MDKEDGNVGVIVIDGSVILKDKKDREKFWNGHCHSQSTHGFHMRRYGHCFYCEHGSVVVDGDVWRVRGKVKK